ncbi:signal peptidase I [Polaribacter cellanae]|uniref:Signal peptidase I n=1 Tax=Polaribacter cellanae TaxID=2818493 RepID=A0A975H7Y3_9FLAO|nr:signal peptidase I [Polaribacter cellanae]QTE23533.1 signal peptidase I [Polaribacter cellanae]
MKKKVVVFLFIIIFFLIGVFWLAFTLALLIITYFGLLKLIYLIKNSFFKKTVKGLFIFSYLLSIIIFVKLVFFDIYKIPSSSMENTLFTNDVIVVNKLKYGPRLPRSPFDIPLLNIGYYFNENARKKIKEYWWPYKRLSGTTEINQGDVIVFNSIWSKTFILVKRCVALPGDKFSIRDTKIYTNSNLFKEPDAVKKDYTFKVKSLNNLYKVLDSFSNNIFLKKENLLSYKASLTKEQLNYLKEQNQIYSTSLISDTITNEKMFVKRPNLKWTFDNMGPVTVPIKGMKIVINEENFEFYRKAINSSENCNITKTNGFFLYR